MEYFTGHAENSTADLKTVEKSLYVWLLKGYLYHLLPVTEDALSYAKGANWFRKTMLVKKGNARFTTPFRLLKDDVYSELSRSFNETEDDVSVFARLFRFVELLLVNFATLAVKPSACQLVAVFFLTEYYLNFLLADVGDREVCVFRAKLRSNQQIAHVMLPFLKKNFASLPIDSSFVTCFGKFPACLDFICSAEILSNFLWPGLEVYKNQEKLKLFLNMSTAHFVELLDVVVERIRNSSVDVLLRRSVIPIFCHLFSAEFIQTLCALRISSAAYLEVVADRLEQFLVSSESAVSVSESWPQVNLVFSHWTPR